MTQLRALFAAMTCLFLFSGCAATVDRVGSSAPLVRPSEQAEKTVVMTLTRVDDEQSIEDWQAFRNEWHDALSNLAAENGTQFRLVEDGDSVDDNAVLIKGTVNGFRYVSPGKRIAFGAMTGNAYMDIGFEFIEVPMGRLLGARQYTTSSRTMEGIFSAMTDRQVRATADAMWKDLFN
ncbi:hypothetical protein [Nitrogeniibacter aestuarii]|uniref:hypothetical protein n=1 Tax=Nitrogeniibacter aestuarii TaxID=2815343 RepID=UPI001E39F18D|nr:hypothetical protein [Nitrogeniibacter aestuarii]